MMKVRGRGFTLIEMLVVLLIIGVLLGITLLSPITGSLHKIVQEQSSRLEVLFAQVRDKALLENVEYGFSVSEEGVYQWWQLPLESKEWVVLGDSPFQPYEIPQVLNIWLETEETSGILRGGEFTVPSIVFYSDRQTTPFKLHIVPSEDTKQSVVLMTDGLSDVEITR